MFCTKPIFYTLILCPSSSFMVSSQALMQLFLLLYLCCNLNQPYLFYLYNVSLSVPTAQVLILSLGLRSCPIVLPTTKHNLHIITRFNFPTRWIYLCIDALTKSFQRSLAYFTIRSNSLPLNYLCIFTFCCHHNPGNTKLLTNHDTSTAKSTNRKKNFRYSAITMRQIWMPFGSLYPCLN